MIRRRLLLAAAGIVLGLAAGELAARIVLPLLPDPPQAAWMKDPACGFRLRPTPPGALPEDDDDFINSLGFRDRNHALAKPAGTFRMLGIGDSFVYGAVPVRDNFLRVAARSLGDLHPGLPTEVLLLGAPGYGPEHETALLQHVGLGLGLDPDFVVLNFFVGNDVTGLPVRGKVIRGRMYFTHSPLWWLNLARKSQLFQLAEGAFYRQWTDGRAQAPSSPAGAKGDTGAAGGGRPVPDLYLQMVRHDLPVYRARPDEGLLDLWDEAEGYLNRFDELCRQAGVPWLLVVIPGAEQVDEALRAGVLAGLRQDPAQYDFDAPQRRLLAWAEAHRVEVLNLLPALRAAHRDDDPLYGPNDTHWNVRGNAVAGRCLGEALAASPAVAPALAPALAPAIGSAEGQAAVIPVR